MGDNLLLLLSVLMSNFFQIGPEQTAHDGCCVLNAVFLLVFEHLITVCQNSLLQTWNRDFRVEINDKVYVL